MSRFAFSQPEIDPRAFEGMENLDILRRKDLWALADRAGVPYTPGATAEQMREILRGWPHIVDAVNRVKQSPDSSAPVDQVVNRMNEDKVGRRIEGQDDEMLKKSNPFVLKKELKKRGISMPKSTKKPEMLRALGVDVPASD